MVTGSPKGSSWPDHRTARGDRFPAADDGPRRDRIRLDREPTDPHVFGRFGTIRDGQDGWQTASQAP